MVKVEEKITVRTCSELIAKGIRCVQFKNKMKLLNSIRSVEVGRELADLPEGEGPVFYVAVDNIRAVITPRDVRVVGVPEEKAKEVVSKIKAALGQ